MPPVPGIARVADLALPEPLIGRCQHHPVGRLDPHQSPGKSRQENPHLLKVSIPWIDGQRMDLGYLGERDRRDLRFKQQSHPAPAPAQGTETSAAAVGEEDGPGAERRSRARRQDYPPEPAGKNTHLPGTDASGLVGVKGGLHQQVGQLGGQGVFETGPVADEFTGKAVSTGELHIGAATGNERDPFIPDPGNGVGRIEQPDPSKGRPRADPSPAGNLGPLENPAIGQDRPVAP